MKNKMIMFAIFFSFGASANCGLSGDVSMRLISCKSHPENEISKDLKVISEREGRVFLYHSNTDTIFSPPYSKTDLKRCLRPYRKVQNPQKYAKLISPFHNSQDFYRCKLEKASQYILLENEVGL